VSRISFPHLPGVASGEPSGLDVAYWSGYQSGRDGEDCHPPAGLSPACCAYWHLGRSEGFADRADEARDGVSLCRCGAVARVFKRDGVARCLDCYRGEFESNIEFRGAWGGHPAWEDPS
jgi:hypothetical protein